MFVLTYIPKNKKDVKYIVRTKGNGSNILFDNLKDARAKALSELSKHNGYWITIFKVIKKKDIGREYQVQMQSISTLHF